MSVDTNGRTGRRPGPVSTKDAILDAARDQFTQHGYKGATLRAIAGQAGVDPGLIRHFFGDKEGLFAASLALPPEAMAAVRESATWTSSAGSRWRRCCTTCFRTSPTTIPACAWPPP